MYNLHPNSLGIFLCVCPVPLQGILVDVQVKGFVADVSVTLKYKNENTAVGAVFVFPVNEDSAIYSFEATVGEKKIIADLQEKRQVMRKLYLQNSLVSLSWGPFTKSLIPHFGAHSHYLLVVMHSKTQSIVV